jgi:tetratricopeptide (TPR) repeat protein
LARPSVEAVKDAPLPLSPSLLQNYPYINKLLDQAVVILEKADKTIREATSPSLREQANPCGDCNDCCRGDIISTHQVSPLEIGLLQIHYGDRVAQDFRDYAEHHQDSEGALLHSICPNYRQLADQNGPRGCKVYPHRPLSCRLFGTYRKQGTVLPVRCTFRGSESEVTDESYFQLPATAELREGMRDFQLFQKKQDGLTLKPSTPESAENVQAAGELNLWEGLNPDDPLDQALGWVASQQYPQALEALKARPPVTPADFEIWGSCLSGIGDYASALKCYQQLMSMVPDREDLLFQAGTNAFLSGDTGMARSFWERSLQTNPGYSPTLAMFGYLAWMAEEWLEAAQFFGRAWEADPSQAGLAEKAHQARQLAENQARNAQDLS